jgi:tellurite resistance protein TerC
MAGRARFSGQEKDVMDSDRIILWIAFNVFVLGMLALDLGVFHRKAHSVSIKEATLWSIVWISLAMVFNLGIYFAWGQQKALEFLTGYVIEKSLSVDNLFVFLMIFQYFATPAEYQHRILFWGILGALILRAIFIATGAALLANFHWMIYLFGAFLVITGIKMLLQGDEKLEPDKNPVVRLFERWVPISKQYHGQRFFIRADGRTQATLLMVVLIVIETTDVIFAVDSIPAIFAITQDPFIVYTSNVFAILGLRALYFMLAGVMEMFVYLKVGLSFVLAFVGAKMLLVDIYKIPIGMSLAVIGAVLLLSIVASLWVRPREEREPRPLTNPVQPRGTFVPGRFSPPSLGVFAAAIIVLAALLTFVKWHSIAGGPTSNEAIAVLRVVEDKVEKARSQQGNVDDASLQLADAKLSSAWSHLEQKRYEQAIIDAQEANRIVSVAP